LIGGRLEAVDWLRGTPELTVWRNSIVFLETSEDQPSPTAVTYMLRALAATGALSEIQGILYGRPYGEKTSFQAYDGALMKVLEEQGLQSLPVITRMDFLDTRIQSLPFRSGSRRKSTATRSGFGFSNPRRFGDGAPSSTELSESSEKV
jgi:hypothetical protein